MQTITVDELKARMDAGEKLNLIDCRNQMNMPNSISVRP